jgi:serine/threonine protein kinase
MAAALNGVLVDNRYEVCERIAVGGMAAVYRGWDRVAQRPVAVKVLRDVSEMRPKDADRFRREGRIASELHCPQIVEVYDFVEEDDGCFLVMELVEGANLKERVVRDGPLPPVEALTIAAAICRALTCAHDAGFIHRDIKPQNVLLAEGGEIKLTDFGIAHISDSTNFTTSGIILGTADYISPEQAQGLALSPATDLYSLGVVLFEMLTGALPFQGSGVVAVAMLHTTKSPPPLRMLNPALPHRLERLVRRALAKKPQQRFHSAAEMERVLLREAAVLRQQSVPSRGDAELTRVLQGRELHAQPAAIADKGDIAAIVTNVTPAAQGWNVSSPNGQFGPPDDPWHSSASLRDDASVPPDIVDAYLFTQANGSSDASPTSGIALSRRTALVLLACAVILVVLLLSRLL